MSSLNKVMLIGRLGSDPESRKTEAGLTITRFSLATAVANPEARPDWHNVVVFGKLADTCQAYLTKGQACYVEGKISYFKQERGDQIKYHTDIVANQIRFLSSKRAPSDPSPVAPLTPADDPSELIDTHIPF